MKKSQLPPAIAFSEVGIIRCLGTAGIPVYAGSDIPQNTGLYSRYSERSLFFSPYNSKEFIQELVEFGKTLDSRPVLLSYDDRLLFNISKNRERLSPYYRYLMPDHSMVESLLDKQKFIRLSQEYDLPTPATVRVSQPSDLQAVPELMKPPYLIKPTYHHIWFNEQFARYVGTYKKAFTCDTLDELEDLYQKISNINPNVVVQEYIEGPDSNMYDVNMYVDAQGAIRGNMITHKLRCYPPLAGNGSYAITTHDDELLEKSKDIVNRLKLVGLVNLQYKKDGDTDKNVLFEIHPRNSIFDTLAVKAGVNLPAIYYADMQGIPSPPAGDYKDGVKYVHIDRELKLFLEVGRKEGMTLRQLLKSYMGQTVFDGFSVHDPKPVFMEAFWSLRRVLSRLRQKKQLSEAPA